METWICLMLERTGLPEPGTNLGIEHFMLSTGLPVAKDERRPTVRRYVRAFNIRLYKFCYRTGFALGE